MIEDSSPPKSNALSQHMLDALAGLRDYEARLPAVRAAGQAALERLSSAAEIGSGQSIVIKRFLLGCYDGTRFPFDLQSLRALDYNLVGDCLAVLLLEANAETNICDLMPGREAELTRFIADLNPDA